MSEKFHSISLQEKDAYYELWDKTPLKSIDYTLANLWGWQEFYALEWKFEKNLCWIKQNRPQTVLWAPIGEWYDADWEKELEEYYKNHYSIIRVPDQLASFMEKKLKNRIRVSDARGQWEYIYNQNDLATLPGNRFHKKKNHYNSYVKAYGKPDYQNVTDQLVQDVLEVQDDWCQWHECDDSPSLLAENEAINRVLSHWDSFRNLVGGSLYAEGKMIAFSVGEKLDDDCLGVHFEKGLNGYRGVYQTMNCEFAKIAGSGFKWINRAQDLDEEGLRQAKMTYMPEKFIRKSRISLNTRTAVEG